VANLKETYSRRTRKVCCRNRFNWLRLWSAFGSLLWQEDIQLFPQNEISWIGVVRHWPLRLSFPFIFLNFCGRKTGSRTVTVHCCWGVLSIVLDFRLSERTISWRRRFWRGWWWCPLDTSRVGVRVDKCTLSALKNASSMRFLGEVESRYASVSQVRAGLRLLLAQCKKQIWESWLHSTESTSQVPYVKKHD
jgi:hypothetical protein